MDATLLEDLRTRILTGRLTPGQRLREVPLSEELGVRRGPLRDVFLQLGTEGLLVATPHAGVRVAQAPSPAKRRTLVKTRRTLESDALALAMETELDRLIAGLETNLRRYRPACRRGSLGRAVPIDLAFHETIIQAAEGGSLLAVWRPVVCQMMLRYSRHRVLLESYEEHRRVVDLIRAGDTRAACASLRKHIV